MTEQTQTTTSPLALTFGLCSPLWPAYGLFMGASLQWWALSRLARFASPVWAFEPKPAPEPEASIIQNVAAPAPVEAAPEPVVEPVSEAAVAFTAAPEQGVAPDRALAAEAEAFAAPVETYAEPTPATPEPELVASPEPTVEPEAPSAPIVSPAPGEVDDLTLIRGVGPRVADALVARGVLTFRQLAEWSEKDMHHFDSEMKLLGRSKRYDFLGQAKALASEA